MDTLRLKTKRLCANIIPYFSESSGFGLAVLKLLYLYAGVEQISKYTAEHESQVSCWWRMLEPCGAGLDQRAGVNAHVPVCVRFVFRQIRASQLWH